MIILHLTGGLGNQMFQYAYGRTVAKKLGTELKLVLTDHTLKIHNGFELDKIFDIQVSEATQADLKAVLGVYRHHRIRQFSKILRLNKILKIPLVQEPHFHFSSKMLNIPDNSYISGYWQSEKYFSELEREIRSLYAFKLPASQKNLDLFQSISQANSVSLHVRRNDYATNARVNSIHGLCTLDYYQAAIKYIAERIDRPKFFIFSDDPFWVKSNLTMDFNYEFVEHNKGRESYNDMRLMSLCRHNITANSSFSWWGAWLNNSNSKIVVSPRKWFQVNEDIDDLIPSAWIKL